MQNKTTDLLSPGTHDIEVDGLRQRYHVHGSGPVCLVVPGGPGVDWKPTRVPAAEEFLTMLYVEPLGTGGSQRLPSHPHGYTRERYARGLTGLLDALSLPRVLVLGHSYGGFVAQYLALHHPDRLSGMVLYESAPVTGPEHMAESAARVEEFVRRNGDRPDLPTVLGGLQASGTAGTTRRSRRRCAICCPSPSRATGSARTSSAACARPSPAPTSRPSTRTWNLTSSTTGPPCRRSPCPPWSSSAGTT